MLTKRQFFIKYVWYFNLYGNLCFLGVFLCGAGIFAAVKAALTFWATARYGYFALVLVLAAALVIGAIAAVMGGTEISGGFEDKFKYYRVTVKRIQKNGFTDELLEDAFDSPCYRLLMRQILRDFGRENEYRRIKRKLFHRPFIWDGENENTSRRARPAVENAKEMYMAFCSNCGTQLEDGAVFCASCGTRVGEADPVAQAAGENP